tara:strand:+ start:405 stop:791 length:387 start_codon:yes stop_codon:yes gene_type:complete
MTRKTPRYTSKNVHGISYGIPVYRSRVIKSFSLTMDNARYLEAVPKGEKSDVVNRALAYYRKGGRARQDQITALEEALGRAYDQLDEKNGLQGGVGDQNSRRKLGSRVSIVDVLTYPFQLLKQRLGWR